MIKAHWRRLILVLTGVLLAELTAPSYRVLAAQTASSQQQLVARLATSEDEARLEALIQLTTLLSSAPDSATEATLAALGQVLQADRSPVMRALAARALGVASTAKATAQLLAALEREGELSVRQAIIYALVHLTEPQVTEKLISLLKDRKAEIRGTAAYALAEIADPGSTRALIEVLQKRRGDEDSFTRSKAAQALGRIGDRTVVAPLVDVLTRDESPEVRREAAQALGLLATKEDTAAIEALKAAKHNRDPYLSRIATAALIQIHQRDK